MLQSEGVGDRRVGTVVSHNNMTSKENDMKGNRFVPENAKIDWSYVTAFTAVAIATFVSLCIIY